MQELNLTEMQQVSGAGGGIRVGSDGFVAPKGGGVRIGSDGFVSAEGGTGVRVGSDGANN